MVDSVPLGALFGPGAPDPDLGHSQIKVQRCGHRGDMKIVNTSLYICISTNIDKNSHGGDSLDKSMRPSKNSIAIIYNC